MAESAKWKTVGLWVIAVVLGLMFLFAGGLKIAGIAEEVEAWTRYGLPPWTLPVVGAVEVLGAILVVVPKTRFWGAEVIAATMIGAALTHLVSGEDTVLLVANGVFFTLAAIVAWATRPAFLRA